MRYNLILVARISFPHTIQTPFLILLLSRVYIHISPKQPNQIPLLDQNMTS